MPLMYLKILLVASQLDSLSISVYLFKSETIDNASYLIIEYRKGLTKLLRKVGLTSVSNLLLTDTKVVATYKFGKSVFVKINKVTCIPNSR